MQMDAIMKAIEAGLKEINHGHKTLCGALAMLRSIDNNTLSVDDRLANRSLWNQVLGSCDHLRQAIIALALRVGIEQSMSIGPPEPFVLKARAMGLRAGHVPAGFNQLADDLEAEAFLESTSEIPKMRPDFFTDRYGFIVDYLAEVMREMRKRSFSDVINKYFNVSGLFSGANK